LGTSKFYYYNKARKHKASHHAPRGNSEHLNDGHSFCFWTNDWLPGPPTSAKEQATGRSYVTLDDGFWSEWNFKNSSIFFQNSFNLKEPLGLEIKHEKGRCMTATFNGVRPSVSIFFCYSALAIGKEEAFLTRCLYSDEHDDQRKHVIGMLMCYSLHLQIFVVLIFFYNNFNHLSYLIFL
jgi:hypothetical protein